jgi:hypothetical protein
MRDLVVTINFPLNLCGIYLKDRNSDGLSALSTMRIQSPLAYLFILFDSCDDAIHPQGICGLGKTKEMDPVGGPRPVYHNKVNPPPSAVRCAQVSGYELPLQESVTRKKEKASKSAPQPTTVTPRGGIQELPFAPRGCYLHRFPRHPLIHPCGVGSILVCPVGHHPTHSRQL